MKDKHIRDENWLTVRVRYDTWRHLARLVRAGFGWTANDVIEQAVANLLKKEIVVRKKDEKTVTVQ